MGRLCEGTSHPRLGATLGCGDHALVRFPLTMVAYRVLTKFLKGQWNQSHPPDSPMTLQLGPWREFRWTQPALSVLSGIVIL